MSKAFELKKHNNTIVVNEGGGMVSGIFDIEGELISPFYSHPWDEREADEGILKWLQGDFVCVPFGVHPHQRIDSYEAEERCKQPAHGLSSNAKWDVKCFNDHVEMHLKYNDCEIDRIQRNVAFLQGLNGIEFKNTIFANSDILMPVAIHPVFRLNEKKGSMRLIVPQCETIATYPIKLDKSSRVKRSIFIEDLSKVPLEDGSEIDLTSLPLAQDAEEIVMLCGLKDNRIILENHEENYRVIVEIDLDCFSNCVLWFSNKGRTFAPWNGRNLCLGIEPATAAFDFGADISRSDNILKKKGIKTAVKICENSAFHIDYKIFVEILNK